MLSILTGVGTVQLKVKRGKKAERTKRKSRRGTEVRYKVRGSGGWLDKLTRGGGGMRDKCNENYL